MRIVPADMDDARHDDLYGAIKNLVPGHRIHVRPPGNYRSIPSPLQQANDTTAAHASRYFQTVFTQLVCNNASRALFLTG